MSEILNWLDGRGVLLLSGGHTAGSPIRAVALSKSKEYGAVAYISTADDKGDALMDDMVDLGARTGYFIDPLYDSPETIIEQLETASLIVLESGDTIDEMYEVLQGAVQEGVQQAYERGALVLIEGLAVNLFGRWVIGDKGDMRDGLNWVRDAFIEPQSAGIADSRAVQAVMQQIPQALAINITAGSGLALGENRSVEILGEREVTISLGKHYLQADD